MGKKLESAKGDQDCRSEVKGWKTSCSIRVVSAGLTEKVTLEQRLEGDEGVSSAAVWGKSILGRGCSQCKGPEAGAGLAV